jgi:galactan endo-1,6-beta-galactosidase
MLYSQRRKSHKLFKAIRFCSVVAVAAGVMAIPVRLSAQNVATLTDVGTSAPAPGPNDMFQLSTSGEAGSPDGLNYYTDNYPSHGGGAPGQTFTTGSNAAGYWLKSLAIKTGGGSSQSTTTPQTYILNIFTVSGATAAGYADFVATNFAFNNGDWLAWSGFSLPLAPKTTYAYCFSRTSSGTGWAQLANASNNPYAAGQIALVPVDGGTITYGASGQFDGVFDLGLALTNPAGPVTLAIVTNLPATAITTTTATLNGEVVSNGNQSPTVTVYYGPGDGGNNAAAWAFSTNTGIENGAYLVTVSGLTTNTSYYFTAAASNAAGIAWARPSLSFSTLAPNLLDLGANPPTPGTYDIAQLSTSGEASSPDGLNYYTDNYPSHGGGTPGQTFTTGSNVPGYWLNTLAIKTGGGGTASTTTLQTYILYIFTVSNNAATPWFSDTATGFGFSDGDWLQWVNLNLLLSPNTTYAYGFSRTASGTGWEQLANASNNPYAGGQIALLPVGGGAINDGASGQFDGVFDLGLSLTNPAGLVSLPVISNSAATGLQPNDATLNGQVLSSGNQVPFVTIYYGPADGGTNASAWAHSVALGLQNGVFSAPVLNLNPNTGYYFTASASNQAGTVWAEPSLSFQTPPSVPILNLATNWGLWQGWGCSLCWWANVFGTRTDLANIVFTTNYTILNGVNLPGLGMNIARYNAGACGTNSVSGQSMVASPNIPGWKQIQGYWLNPSSSDPGTTNWNWNADANQRAMMLMAQARGATIQLFSNSPMWWMLDNFNPSGPTTASTDNLQPAYDDAHAVYLAAIAAYARTNWGVTFNSVEAFNEPHGSWWTATGTQEGCYFDTPTQATVIQYLRTELNNRGLTNMPIAASDETSFDQSLSTWQGFSSTVQRDVDIVTTHDYGYDSGSGLYAAAGGKTLWNTEYGEGDGTGISMATNLDLTFASVHPTAWCYWQPFDGDGWGLIQSDPGSSTISTPNPKYYVLAQYTRHIRPGMTILDSLAANTVAAYSVTNHTLVLVTCNVGPAQTMSFCLTNIPYVAGPVTRWITVPNTSTNYAQYNDVSITNGAFQAAFPANSIQTFQIASVYLTAPTAPVVTATLSGGQLSLSWPGWASNYSLYYATNLKPPVAWLALTNQPQSINGNLDVVVPATNGIAHFYRLKGN